MKEGGAEGGVADTGESRSRRPGKVGTLGLALFCLATHLLSGLRKGGSRPPIRDPGQLRKRKHSRDRGLMAYGKCYLTSRIRGAHIADDPLHPNPVVLGILIHWVFRGNHSGTTSGFAAGAIEGGDRSSDRQWQPKFSCSKGPVIRYSTAPDDPAAGQQY